MSTFKHFFAFLATAWILVFAADSNLCFPTDTILLDLLIARWAFSMAQIVTLMPTFQLLFTLLLAIFNLSSTENWWIQKEFAASARFGVVVVKVARLTDSFMTKLGALVFLARQGSTAFFETKMRALVLLCDAAVLRASMVLAGLCLVTGLIAFEERN